MAGDLPDASSFEFLKGLGALFLTVVTGIATALGVTWRVGSKMAESVELARRLDRVELREVGAATKTDITEIKTMLAALTTRVDHIMGLVHGRGGEDSFSEIKTVISALTLRVDHMDRLVEQLLAHGRGRYAAK